jgi:gamma-glutamylcyclotransferase (GGCT)/AIG2-like uncharacterized protein YtfP
MDRTHVIFFSYGTLLDPDYQRELFGGTVPTTPATLHGWRAVFTESGYLTIVPRADGIVRGALVTVDERELAICDAWEDVPLYERVPVRVHGDDGAPVGGGATIDTWAYVRQVASGEPAPTGVLSRASRETVIAAIRRFREDGRGHTA